MREFSNQINVWLNKNIFKNLKCNKYWWWFQIHKRFNNSLSQISCAIVKQKLIIFDIITFALTKINEIKNLTCNCFTCYQILIKKRRQYRQFLIEHFDENILKSIRKYCKSNRNYKENVVNTDNFWSNFRCETHLIEHFNKKHFKTYVIELNKRNNSSNIEHDFKWHANTIENCETNESLQIFR